MSTQRLRTGMARLDALLGGGFLPGMVLVLATTAEAAKALAHQLFAAVEHHNADRGTAGLGCIVDLGPCTDPEADVFREVRRMREAGGVTFAFCAAGKSTAGMGNMIDATLILDVVNRRLNVARSRGGALGGIQLREQGGALVEDERAPSVAPDHSFREGERRAWAEAEQLAREHIARCTSRDARYDALVALLDDLSAAAMRAGTKRA